MAFAFQIIEGCHIHPAQAPFHRDGEKGLLPRPQPGHRLLQLLRKGKVGHRLEHIIQRIHRIAPDGELGHVGDEDEQHVLVHLADAFGGGHAVHAAHLYIQQDDVINGTVVGDDLVPVIEQAQLKHPPELAFIAADIIGQLGLHLFVVLHNGNADHACAAPFLMGILVLLYTTEAAFVNALLRQTGQTPKPPPP